MLTAPRLQRLLVPALVALAVTGPASAQLHSRRLLPPGEDVPGVLGVTDAAQPLVAALPAWQVPALTPYVNLFSGGLFLRYNAVAAPAIGFDWDLSLFYNSTLATETGTLGKGWRHSYDTALLLNTPPGAITVRWGDGRRDVFSPSGGGWTGPAPLDGRTIVAITGGYRLSTKHGERHEFNTSGQLIRLVDRNLNTTTLTYGSGRLASISDASGRSLTFAYDLSGRLVSIGGFLAQPISFGYSSDRLVSITESEGFPFTFGYDGSDRLVRITDSQGRSTHVGYYSSLQVVQWARAACARREYFFDSGSHTTVVRDSVDLGGTAQTTYHFNADGTVGQVLQADLGVATSTWDPSTLKLLTHTDPNGHIWTHTYNAFGDHLSAKSPLNETWSWTYDPTYHLPATLTEPLAGSPVWQWLRDSNGNVTTFRDPDHQDWTWTYSGEGLPMAATDPNNNTTTFAYDSDGNLTSILDPANYGQQFTYDARGNLLTYTDALFYQWSIDRDGRDGVTRLNQPGGNYYTLEWWPDGRPRGVTDPDGMETRYSYDALDRLVRTRGPTDSTDIERDGRGLPRGLFDGFGNDLDLEHDGSGRPRRTVDPGGGTHEYQYDGLDRTLRRLPDATEIRYVHDARHRVILRVCGDDTTRYEYDALNRVIRAVRTAPPAPVIEYEYTYDTVGRMTRKESRHLQRSLDYTFDPAGRVQRLDDNLQATPWEYGYDNRDQITSFQAGLDVDLAMTYTERREPYTTSISPTGSSINESADALERRQYLSTSSPWSSSSWSATYSPAGDLLYCSGYASWLGYVNLSATYDPNHRLLTEDHSPLAAFTYGLDGDGNRISKDGPDGYESYGYAAGHRLISAGALSQTWNANGDVVTSGTPAHPIAYAYRPDRSLAAVTDSGSVWGFVPGPFGEIAAVVAPAGDTTWFDSDRGPTGLFRRATFPGRGVPPAAEYGYIPGSSGTTPRFRKSGSDVQVILPSWFGVGEVVDYASGLVTGRYTSMFGERLATSGTVTTAPGYHDMDALSEPNGPLLLGESRGDRSAGSEDLAYLPTIGSYQRDLGFGPDFMASVGSWPPKGFYLDPDGNLVPIPKPPPRIILPPDPGLPYCPPDNLWQTFGLPSAGGGTLFLPPLEPPVVPPPGGAGDPPQPVPPEFDPGGFRWNPFPPDDGWYVDDLRQVHERLSEFRSFPGPRILPSPGYPKEY